MEWFLVLTSLMMETLSWW